MHSSSLLRCLTLAALFLTTGSTQTVAQSVHVQPAASVPDKPVNTARPWTFWWWMGSAVTETELTRQLTQFAEAGLGGVHIIPIYGVKG